MIMGLSKIILKVVESRSAPAIVTADIPGDGFIRGTEIR